MGIADQTAGPEHLPKRYSRFKPIAQCAIAPAHERIDKRLPELGDLVDLLNDGEADRN
jgi:hypothetical protein